MLRRGASIGAIARRQCCSSVTRILSSRHSFSHKRRYASAHAQTDYADQPQAPLAAPFLTKGKEKQVDNLGADSQQEHANRAGSDKVIKAAAKSFENAGLNARLSLQLVNAFPFIRSPTAAQEVILSTARLDNDLIIRAHTGTGKSFCLFLALLNKPRLVTQARIDDDNSSTAEKTKRITSIIVVPTQELAKQYETWAKQLFPRNMHHTISSVVAIKYRSKETTMEEHIKQLASTPPHLLVITATLLNNMLTTAKGQQVISIPTLRTLVMDEVDALLDLPGRFPSNKLIWNHLKHPSEGLQVLNRIMKTRRTFSCGTPIPSMGLEPNDPSISSDVRRVAHQGNDLLRERSQRRGKAGFTLNLAKEYYAIERPLQLIVVSATANSVLRHFLGARTGWLRTGLRDQKQETGKWLDLTGLSKGVNKAIEVRGKGEHSQSGWALQLPKELKHSCIIVDEPSGDGEAENWRELQPKEARSAASSSIDDANSLPSKSTNNAQKGGPIIVAPSQSPSSALDENLLTCLAFQFASQPVQQALALIPAGWSLLKTKAFLSQLEIPVLSLDEPHQRDETEPVLYILQATSVRGLDVPGGLSHIFCLGIDSVQDAVTYTHLAGRAARIGHDQSGAHIRPPGHVITLLRGLNADQVRANRKSIKEHKSNAFITSSELKMSLIYRRLDLGIQKVDALRYDEVQNVMVSDSEGEGNVPAVQ